ncbi:uncharacterized protein K489DRAFT_369079 [Dissoconium aciculare CBS 342.82]|uniref:Uncharacterized protein n=1 Tax=Dissoconium aciculare CBS 342.82 TaxID=1314786 RepID=A0A6J3MBF3_9PEZI|nr:uncharacterized protein K489DRAFT_369079 [Dissoconium aciculare CBS 342.82]KAF1824162.1 hypothetical protein K489DRAFT_369079 [Dissoconium aciculare CBS 342.82]
MSRPFMRVHRQSNYRHAGEPMRAGCRVQGLGASPLMSRVATEMDPAEGNRPNEIWTDMHDRLDVRPAHRIMSQRCMRFRCRIIRGRELRSAEVRTQFCEDTTSMCNAKMHSKQNDRASQDDNQAHDRSGGHEDIPRALEKDVKAGAAIPRGALRFGVCAEWDGRN